MRTHFLFLFLFLSTQVFANQDFDSVEDVQQDEEFQDYDVVQMFQKSVRKFKSRRDFKGGNPVLQYKLLEAEAQNSIRFCFLYNQEFKNHVQACSKYSDRAIKVLNDITQSTCGQLQSGLEELRQYLQSNQCAGEDASSFSNLSDKLKNMQSLLQSVNQQLAQYKASLSQDQSVPFAGKFTREVLVAWSMESSEKYPNCSRAALGAQDTSGGLQALGISNDSSKVYYRWKKVLMCADRPESATMAKSGSSPDEKRLLQQIRVMLANRGTVLRYNGDQVSSSGQNLSWNLWLDQKADGNVNAGRVQLSDQAQSAWRTLRSSSCLSQQISSLGSSAGTLAALAEKNDKSVLGLCKR